MCVWCGCLVGCVVLACVVLLFWCGVCCVGGLVAFEVAWRVGCGLVRFRFVALLSVLMCACDVLLWCGVLP